MKNPKTWNTSKQKTLKQKKTNNLNLKPKKLEALKLNHFNQTWNISQSNIWLESKNLITKITHLNESENLKTDITNIKVKKHIFHPSINLILLKDSSKNFKSLNQKLLIQKTLKHKYFFLNQNSMNINQTWNLSWLWQVTETISKT